MKLDSSNIISIITSSVGTIYTLITESTVYQIIVGILTIIGLLFNIIYTAWKWYRKSKSDNKITEDEVDELMDSINDVINKDVIDHGKQ